MFLHDVGILAFGTKKTVVPFRLLILPRGESGAFQTSHRGIRRPYILKQKKCLTDLMRLRLEKISVAKIAHFKKKKKKKLHICGNKI